MKLTRAAFVALVAVAASCAAGPPPLWYPTSPAVEKLLRPERADCFAYRQGTRCFTRYGTIEQYHRTVLNRGTTRERWVTYLRGVEGGRGTWRFEMRYVGGVRYVFATSSMFAGTRSTRWQS